MTEQTKHEPSYRFHFQGDIEPVLILTKQGFTYKGETVDDAGQAYQIWMEVMTKVKDGA